jgi:membrane associated rhomboid family serine protease
MNWLFVVINVAVFILQLHMLFQAGDLTAGINGVMLLDGWHWRGLLGHMWLHGGLFHLIGNMLFLWIFGNAVCATLGNFRYLCLYLLWGVCAGMVHLMVSEHPALGASGAINGVVGVFLFLYARNQITCYFVFWFIYPIVRGFTVSSYVMILWWLFWDVLGAFTGAGQVAFGAHLGGFCSGFASAWIMCALGWIDLMEHEESLLDIWRRHKTPQQERSDLLGSGRPLPVQHGSTQLVASASNRSVADGFAAEDYPWSDVPVSPNIQFHCLCGHAINVPQTYAGRSGRCPKCKAVVQVPSSHSARSPRQTATSSSESLIRVVCPCGKVIKVPVRLAGRSGRCPQCHMKLRIPNPNHTGGAS